MARTTAHAPTVADLLEQRVSEALRRDIPPEIATHARLATLCRLGRAASEPASSPQGARADAYFAAVVRRQVLRRGQPHRAAARFVLATVIQDLRESGRDGESIWSELERGWNDVAPHDVLEEYRLRLCG